MFRIYSCAVRLARTPLVRPSLRGFSQCRTVLESAKKEPSLAEKVETIDSALRDVEEESKYELSDASLAERPDLWKGLPAEKIIRLHKQRVVAMGAAYERSGEELDALLTTATTPEEAAFIEKAYCDTEATQFAADSDTDYDNFMEEGEYMDDAAEPNEYDEYPTVAQEIVQDFREQLDFNRKAAFELPALAKYRQEYVPVSKKERPVTYTYTSFLGESNPAERKVVLKLQVADLGLPEAAAHKLKLLAGSRYDYTTDEFKMSSDKFLEPAQNATYLADILKDLVAESKKEPEEFADVPLDKRAVDARLAKRQHRNKKVYAFPKEWERPIAAGDRKVDINKLMEID